MLSFKTNASFQALETKVGSFSDIKDPAFSTLLVEKSEAAFTALTIAFLQARTQKNVIFITGRLKEELLFEDLSFFQNQVLEFPALETFAFESMSPSSDLIGQRFSTLNRLASDSRPAIILAPLEAVLQKMPPLDYLKAQFYQLEKGKFFAFQEIEKRLTHLGYQKTSSVTDKKEFALRGGILDIFPPSSDAPYRIEFFGDVVEEIRVFDPASQKSIEKTSQAFIPPAVQNWQQADFSLLEFLPNAIVALDDFYHLEESFLNFKKAIKHKPEEKNFFSLDDFFQKAAKHQKIFFLNHQLEELSPSASIKYQTTTNPYFENCSFEALGFHWQAENWKHAFQRVEEYLDDKLIAFENSYEALEKLFQLRTDVFLLSENEAIKTALQKSLKANLKKEYLKPLEKAVFKTGFLSSDVVLKDQNTALLPSSFFTHKKRIRRQKWRRFAYHTPASEFHHLSPGDMVVHFHSGIGKYLGIEKHKFLGTDTEFMAIEYAQEAKLFVPISQSYLVSRYIGAHEEGPSLSKLGSNKWQKTKASVQKKIIGYAAELLELYAQRTLKKGYQITEDSEEMQLFELEFPYTETVDQNLAIQAIKEDFKKPEPMERLLSGDVGYGKTEVAMRAAFKMAFDGKKQVAMLVPTTILALQHFETFKERFSSYPINIALLSRFNTAKENQQIIAQAKEGTVDILIGTHRLLSQDVSFKDLGLLIIDEEHRFGVRAKEKLKKVKANHNIDVLAMSATPIPRTLYMSLINIRDISQINTPPQDRLPIRTILAENTEEVIKNALLQEILREGQVFILHNRTETIFQRKNQIQKLTPEAKILVVHGQMQAEEIEDIFHQFKNKEADILLATTIIENGIDIPNANTIIIENADTFGLADLYQLRGRVGRWNRQAYAYFLTPKGKKLSDIAKKRLLALAETPGFGGGGKIAMRDLELRGAGDLLGVQQSGQVAEIGFHLYCKLLKRAVNALKEKKPLSFIEPKMEFSYTAFLPESYIPESKLRMEIYHRIGEALSFDEIEEIKKELLDRFGTVPEEALWLLHMAKIKIFAIQEELTYLKFGKYTLFIQKERGKETMQKNLLLPPEMQKNPNILEKFVLKSIAEKFI